MNKTCFGYESCAEDNVAICNRNIKKPKIARYIEACGDVTEKAAVVV